MDGIKKINENVTREGRALTITSKAVRDYEGIPNGTIRCDIQNKGLDFKEALNLWSKFDAYYTLLEGSIVTDLIANKAVTNPKIGDSAVDTRTLANDAVTTIKIKNLNVTTEKINNSAVTTIKIADQNVTTDKIQDLGVTTQKIADLNITTQKIANEAIIENKIADSAVTNSKIMNLTVDNNKIANNTIQYEKYANQSIYGAKIKDGGIETIHLADYSITTGKLSTGAVTTAKIADRQITDAKIAENSIHNEHLSNNTLLENVFANESVDTRIIKNESVTLEKLDPNLRSKVEEANKDCIKYNDRNDVYIDRSNDSNLIVSGDIAAKGRVFNAVYKDLAEAYEPGEFLEPGDIVEYRETDKKVYRASGITNTVVGVISDDFAACFGATREELESLTKVPVGLIGVVKVKINGEVNAGQKIVVERNGLAKAVDNPTQTQIIIGKALETNTQTGVRLIDCLIFPN